MPERMRMADYDAMCRDLGYEPTEKERDAIANALPVLNRMTAREFEATYRSALAKVRSSMPWWERWWDRLLDWFDF